MASKWVTIEYNDGTVKINIVAKTMKKALKELCDYKVTITKKQK